MAFQVKISALATILFIVWLGFRNVAESKPDTTIITRGCDGANFTKTDPFAKSLDFILKDLMKVTPKTKGFEYSNNSSSLQPSSVLFGDASCSKKLGVYKLGVYDCSKCLIKASNVIQDSCPRVTNAQTVLKDCSIEYQTAPFKAEP